MSNQKSTLLTPTLITFKPKGGMPRFELNGAEIRTKKNIGQ